MNKLEYYNKAKKEVLSLNQGCWERISQSIDSTYKGCKYKDDYYHVRKELFYGDRIIAVENQVQAKGDQHIQLKIHLPGLLVKFKMFNSDWDEEVNDYSIEDIRRAIKKLKTREAE